MVILAPLISSTVASELITPIYISQIPNGSPQRNSIAVVNCFFPVVFGVISTGIVEQLGTEV
jgi:hypothetical protein